jgi:hypothetical protein
VDVADFGADRERQHPPHAGNGEQERDVGVVGVAEAQPAVDEVDLGVEVIDQRQARLDGSAPRLRDRQAVEQLAAGDAEEIRHRARMPEGDQRRVDAVLVWRRRGDSTTARTCDRSG